MPEVGGTISLGTIFWVTGVGFLVFLVLIFLLKSWRHIGADQVGLLNKKLGKKLSEGNPIAFNGEAGYQAKLLMPGWRFANCILYGVKKFPWVQVPSDGIGLVISQIGNSMDPGAKSAVYKKEFGDFIDLDAFLKNGGQKGPQRKVLQPGFVGPIHPIAFVIVTHAGTFGQSMDPSIMKDGEFNLESMGLSSEKLVVTKIERPSDTSRDKEPVDNIGIVTINEGPPISSGNFASRLGGWAEIEELEKAGESDEEIIEALLSMAPNAKHSSYQDIQLFLDSGGEMGLQFAPITYGAFLFNPLLVNVEKVAMLIVKQGEVAVIRAHVGLPTIDTSGEAFKHGCLVRPGRRGIWQIALGTGKYPLNTRCFQPEIVPTQIITLNWSERTSLAHALDKNLSTITAKSIEGFAFKIDLQIQIHIDYKKAPKVISMVGTMTNLVEEILQAAAGNFFRETVQSMKGAEFIQKRKEVQEKAKAYIAEQLKLYDVELVGVLIQDITFPVELTDVLEKREIAAQEIITFEEQAKAEEKRVTMEHTKATADRQKDLAESEVEIKIQENKAKARTAEAEGEAAYVKKTGEVAGAQILAVGMANAEAYKAQVEALGQSGTIAVNVTDKLGNAQGSLQLPQIVVLGGGSTIEGAGATLMHYLHNITPKAPTLPDSTKEDAKAA